MTSLAGEAARGAAYTLAGQALRLTIQMAALVILARLLSPSDFGLVAMVTAIVGVGELIRDFGLSNASIQSRDLTRQQWSNLFWISSGLGLIVGAAVVAAAPLLAGFYGESELVGIALALSTTFVVNGVSAQFRASLARQLRFRALAISETVPPLVATVAAIALAYYGQGYWAIVAQQVLQAVVGMIIVAALARRLPTWPRRTTGMRSLMSYGLNLLGAQTVAYFSRNIDTITIGARFGSTQLGYYSRAFEIVMNPLNQISAPSSKVAIPILSKLQDDLARFDDYLLRGQKVLLVTITPALLIVIVAASPIVAIVLGDDWAPSAPFIQILAVAGILRVAAYPSFWIALSRGYTRVSLYVNLLSAPIFAICVVLGSLAGPLGVAWGFVAATLSTWVVSLILYRGIANAPSWRLFTSAITVFLTYAPAAITASIGTALLPVTSPWAQTGSVMLVFAATHALVILVVRPARRDLREVIAVGRMLRKR